MICSSAVEVAEPARFWAWQVYEPRCLWPTELIIKKLVLVPKLLVMIPESELMLIPWKVHRIDNGWSPAETLHSIWAEVPSSNVSWPKVMGTNFGGSESNSKNWVLRSLKIHQFHIGNCTKTNGKKTFCLPWGLTNIVLLFKSYYVLFVFTTTNH